MDGPVLTTNIESKWNNNINYGNLNNILILNLLLSNQGFLNNILLFNTTIDIIINILINDTKLFSTIGKKSLLKSKLSNSLDAIYKKIDYLLDNYDINKLEAIELNMYADMDNIMKFIYSKELEYTIESCNRIRDYQKEKIFEFIDSTPKPSPREISPVNIIKEHMLQRIMHGAKKRKSKKTKSKRRIKRRKRTKRRKH